MKIGLLLPYTGIDTAQGTDVTNGFELYLAMAGRSTGTCDIEIIKEDDEAKPEVALMRLKKLVEADRVDFLVGPISSAVVLAIRHYVRECGVPLVVPAAFTRVLTAPNEAAPNIFRLSETSDQANYPMGSWIMEHTPYRNIIVMAADFAGGRHSVEAFMAGFRAAGGKIAAEIYPPFGNSDFGPALRQAAAFDADAVYAWFAGADAVHFLTQYKDYGLDRTLPLTGHSALTSDTILPVIGKAALGIITTGSYSATVDTQDNHQFVRDYEAAYNSRPSRYSECGWVAAALITTAVHDLNGALSDPARTRAALKTALAKIRPPRGTMEFDRYGQAITPIYITRTEEQFGRVMNVVIDTLPAVTQEQTWGWWNRTSQDAAK